MKYEFRRVPACDMCDGTDTQFLGMRLSASQGMMPRKAEGVAVPVKKCRACGLIFSDPQPIPADLSDHYGIPPEDYWNQTDFGWNAEYFSTELNVAKRLLKFREGMKALDIGVGLGKSMKSLAAAGFDAWGIEPSAPFRDNAIARQGLEPARVILAAAEDACFPNEQFDFITFGAVLEHLQSPSVALQKAIRWLKPGGIIQAEVPSSSWLVAKVVNRWFRAMGTNYVTHLSPMHPPFHLYEFTRRSFELNGDRLGYDIAEAHYMTCSVPHLPLKAFWRRVMDATDTGMQLTVYLRRR